MFIFLPLDSFLEMFADLTDVGVPLIAVVEIFEGICDWLGWTSDLVQSSLHGTLFATALPWLWSC